MTLMKHIGTDVSTNHGLSTNFLKYKCPKQTCGVFVRFREKTGFSNPYRHLFSCYGMGKSSEEQEKILSELYEEVIELADKHGGTVLNHFQVSALTDYEKMIYSHLKLIIDCNLPISLVESPMLRSLSKYRKVEGARQLWFH